VLGSGSGQQGSTWSRTYTGLSSHNQINLTYIIYPIDSWVIN